MPLRGLSVSRAYISLLKPHLRGEIPVLLGFLWFFWNGKMAGLLAYTICCGFEPHLLDMWYIGRRPSVVTAREVTEVLETVRRYYVARRSCWICWESGLIRKSWGGLRTRARAQFTLATRRTKAN